jgi:hypothetical protein
MPYPSPTTAVSRPRRRGRRRAPPRASCSKATRNRFGKGPSRAGWRREVAAEHARDPSESARLRVASSVARRGRLSKRSRPCRTRCLPGRTAVPRTLPRAPGDHEQIDRADAVDRLPQLGAGTGVRAPLSFSPLPIVASSQAAVMTRLSVGYPPRCGHRSVLPVRRPASRSSAGARPGAGPPGPVHAGTSTPGSARRPLGLSSRHRARDPGEERGAVGAERRDSVVGRLGVTIGRRRGPDVGGIHLVF